MEKDQSTDLIDEILTEADPGFVKDLSGIDPEVLNGQEIQQVSEDSSPATPAAGWKQRLWGAQNKRMRIVMAAGGFVVGVAVPMILLAFFGFFTPKYTEEDGYSLDRDADETFTIEAGEGTQNLFKMFPVLVYAIEIEEKIYTFRQGSPVRFGRFAFYIELFDRKDLLAYDQRLEHVEEAIVNVMRRTSSEDWIGPKHKERFREMLLTEINKVMKVRAKNVRFKSIFI